MLLIKVVQMKHYRIETYGFAMKHTGLLYHTSTGCCLLKQERVLASTVAFSSHRVLQLGMKRRFQTPVNSLVMYVVVFLKMYLQVLVDVTIQG